MITYNKRTLYTAIASAGTLAATAAQAVNVSADGRGQVLLYPYYTARVDSAGNPFGTLLSVVNANASAKAVRVRFLEGKNGREVLAFNLFLSPRDVWTAAVLSDPATGGARLSTTDPACILPPLPATATTTFVPFVNAGYTGVNSDGGGTGLDRTKEGYVEIIEMASYARTTLTGREITEFNGPPSCSNELTDAQAAVDAQPPGGGLSGTASFINVATVQEYTADAVALANFYQIGSNYVAPGTSLPNLTQAAPPVSTVRTSNGAVYESRWDMGTADPVSAVLMHDSLINEFAVDSDTKRGTDWVVTFPTKRYYVSSGSGNASRLFQHNFNGSGGSCDDLEFSLSDRAARRSSYAIAAPVQSASICWAANVISFNNTDVLGSQNALGKSSPFRNGWMTLGFPTDIAGGAPDVHRLINSGSTTIRGLGIPDTTGNTVIYKGLPAIGFAVASFPDDTLRLSPAGKLWSQVRSQVRSFVREVDFDIVP